MEYLEDLLMQRTGCSKEDAVGILEDVGRMDSSLQGVWETWCQCEEVDNHLRVEGYTIADLMEHYGLEFTGAILTMDWLLKDPITAKKALAYGIR